MSSVSVLILGNGAFKWRPVPRVRVHVGSRCTFMQAWVSKKRNEASHDLMLAPNCWSSINSISFSEQTQPHGVSSVTVTFPSRGGDSGTGVAGGVDNRMLDTSGPGA